MAKDEHWAALLGSAGTKRKIYLEHAAMRIGLHVLFIRWEEWKEQFWEKWIARHGTQGILKIDPPRWDSAELSEFPKLIRVYQDRLRVLEMLSEKTGIHFLNHPRDIAGLLDKRACKARLSRAGLPVTEELFAEGWKEAEAVDLSGRVLEAGTVDCSGCVLEAGTVDCSGHVLETGTVDSSGRVLETGTVDSSGHVLEAGTVETQSCFQESGEVVSRTRQRSSGIKTAEELLELMRLCRVYQVFIKPNYGSGALGVTAFRWQPRTGRMFLYTCAAFDPISRCLVNTKRMQCIDGRHEAMEQLNRLLKLDCVVERWYAKAVHDGYIYDLRAVIQDGQMDFLLARLSKGPITNLQLNNHPLPAEKLGLSSSVLASVETLCQDAVKLYPGIRSVGMDILLEKGSLRPRIIEMNGQGDLIYQDIYHENRIYSHQVHMLAEDGIQEKQP